MNKPLISVIIPVYNQEKYCGQAINSIIEQTYQNFELIVVNDGSTDSSLSVIQEKCLGNPKAIILNQSNQGPSSAINAGMKIAKGEFIVLCGGDDIATVDRLQTQLDTITQSSCDIVFSYPYLINEIGTLVDDGHFKIFFNIPKDFTSQPFRSLFLNGNFLCAPAALFKSSLINEIGVFNPDLIQLQDYDYWMRALGQGKKILLSEKRIVFYRRHTSNLSSRNSDSLLNGEYQFLFSKILDSTKSQILRDNFSEILIPSDNNAPLSEYEKASILIGSPLIQSKFAGLHKLLSLSQNERNFLKNKGVSVFTLILNTFKQIEDSDKQQEEIASLKANLKQVLDSTSWKITRPIRVLKGILSGRISLSDALLKAVKKN